MPTSSSSSSYLDMFAMMRLESTELQNYTRYSILRERGYDWIRRYDGRRFESIVRRPTVGCIVEIFKQQYPGCVPIDSPKGQRLIHRICYF